MDGKPRRWLRLRLRTLLIAMAVLAPSLSWTAHSLSWIEQRHELKLRRSSTWKAVFFSPVDHDPPPAPGGLWVFGQKVESSLVLQFDGPDEELDRMARLFPEAKVARWSPPKRP